MSFWDETAPKIAREYWANPDDFLRQPTIARCLHPNDQRLATQLWETLAPLTVATAHQFADSPLGNPWPFQGCRAISPVTVQYLHYSEAMLKEWGAAIRNPRIGVLELGAGYGSFCRYCFKAGTVRHWTIVDLPIMQEIQRDFLLRDPGRKSVTFWTEGEKRPDPDTTLFVATFSLSELPLVERQKWCEILKDFRFIFIAYNSAFEGINNHEYFDRLGVRLTATHACTSVHGVRGRRYLLAEKL